MSEIPLPPPSPEMLYGTDLFTSIENYSNGIYANGDTMAIERFTDGIDPIIGELPFEKNRNGEFLDNAPDGLRINNESNITQIRDRLAHKGLLSQVELEAVMNLAVGNTLSAVAKLIPNSAEFSGVFESFSSQAFTHTKINRQNGTDEDPYIKGDIITIDVSRSDEITEKLVESPDINWKNPGDARLVKYISDLVHEHGHAVARKIAESSNPPGKFSSSFFASYLSAYPNEGYTGILGSDPNIYDERYANGLAVLTVSYTMSQLGYSEAEQQTAIRLCMPLDQEYSYGVHHHVEAVEYARERNITIGQAALELSGLVGNEHLAYEGGMGYKKPLTPKQLGEVFYFAKEITADGVDASRLSAERYKEAFDAQYRGNLHPDVEERLTNVRASNSA